MNVKESDSNPFIIIISVFILIIVLLLVYGFYDKHTKEKLYQDFKANKIIMCGDTQIQKARGWQIHNNKFFTNGKIMKTIAFCKSVD